MHIAILGRQPAIGVAELERLYGAKAVSWFGETSARIDNDTFDFTHLVGSLKAGQVTLELPGGNWRRVSTAIVEHYLKAWQSTEHKLTLGISAYGWDVSTRDVQGTGIVLKKKLRTHNVSVRLIPNQDIALSTATSHHNKLGANPHRIELLVVRGASGRIIVAESVGTQNISAFAARDQARPRTDAFVGMLPPKLARIMVNLAITQGGRATTLSSFAKGSAFPAEGETRQVAASGSPVPEEKESGRIHPQVIDFYSGVGSIGLTIGGKGCTLVEINEDAVREMRRNITELGSDATAVLAASEQALEYITADKTIILDPPRAGLHADVITRLLEVLPGRIIYLSCNPVTQARDVAMLAEGYGIRAHRGYNFFPRTPHIEHLVILDRK